MTCDYCGLPLEQEWDEGLWEGSLVPYWTHRTEAEQLTCNGGGAQ